MFIDKPVPYWPEWLQVIEKPDYESDYMKTFGCLCATGFSVIFPDYISSYLINKIAYAAVRKEEADFIYKSYLPEIQDAVRSIPIPM